MKLTIKFNNGYWKHFDPVQYRDVAIFDTRKEAEQALVRKPRSK